MNWKAFWIGFFATLIIIWFPLQVIAVALVAGVLFFLALLVVILQAFITAINDVLDS